MAWTAGNMFTGAATDFKIAGTSVGGTTDGVRLGREVDWLDFEIDQVKFKVKKQPILASMTIETTFIESTVANIQKAWSIPSGALSGTSLELQEPSGAAAEEVEVQVEGPGPAATPTRVYNFGRCVAFADGELNLDRGAPAGVPVRFDVLTETGSSPSSFGRIYDV